MWNWKMIHEDNDLVYYMDIENISDSKADEDGIYSSFECYQTLSDRVAIWVMFFIKNKDIIKRYNEYLKENGIVPKGYRDYSSTLCLVELDATKELYRVIPALDYDSKGRELGVSKIITDDGKSFIKGIKGDWSSIKSRNTNKAIKTIFKFLYRSDN
ncbi:MAG TPA: hypothetical protein PKW07_09760 [Syntrophorhabdaceae bacterium]|nr:hypothetical protein [Syntrophorhabdaceae bacterium]